MLRAILIVTWTWALASSALLFAKPARADEVSDLLQQADRVLSPGKASNKAAGDESGATDAGSEKDKPRAPAKKSRSSPPPSDGATTASPASTPANPSAAPNSMTPTDLENVSQLLSVTHSDAAALKPAVMSQGLTVGTGVARISGRYELEKDDDTFVSAGRPYLPGLSLAWTSDLTQTPRSVFGWTEVLPTWRLETAFFRGQASIRRTGIQNEEFNGEYNLVAVSPQIGVHSVRTGGGFSWSLNYGPALESLVQIGRGETDSTTGSFTSDSLSAGAGWKTSSILLELVIAARGLLSLDRGKPGSQTVLASLFIPVSG